jgi:hypothetical protein
VISHRSEIFTNDPQLRAMQKVNAAKLSLLVMGAKAACSLPSSFPGRDEVANPESIEPQIPPRNGFRARAEAHPE